MYTDENYGTPAINIQRETLNIMDDTTRVAMVDTAVVDNVNSPVEGQLLRYQLTDHLSTASLELDETALVITYEEYYPYGSTSFQSGRSLAEVSLKRYRYTGKERDEETGFFYHGARYYIPWLARWCAVDPINSEFYNQLNGNTDRNFKRDFIELTASSYEYSYDNPIRFFDFSGEQPTQEQMSESGRQQMLDRVNSDKQVQDAIKGDRRVLLHQRINDVDQPVQILNEGRSGSRIFNVNQSGHYRKDGSLAWPGGGEKRSYESGPIYDPVTPIQPRPIKEIPVEIDRPQLNPVAYPVPTPNVPTGVPQALPINFVQNSDQFVNRQSAMRSIASLAQIMRSSPSVTVTIIGNSSFNTNSQEARQYSNNIGQNLTPLNVPTTNTIQGLTTNGTIGNLMIARAQAVVNTLVRQFGINPNRLRVQLGRLNSGQTTQFRINQPPQPQRSP